jgi:hypothetical protein
MNCFSELMVSWSKCMVLLLTGLLESIAVIDDESESCNGYCRVTVGGAFMAGSNTVVDEFVYISPPCPSTVPPLR